MFISSLVVNVNSYFISIQIMNRFNLFHISLNAQLPFILVSKHYAIYVTRSYKNLMFTLFRCHLETRSSRRKLIGHKIDIHPDESRISNISFYTCRLSRIKTLPEVYILMLIKSMLKLPRMINKYFWPEDRFRIKEVH